MDRVEQRLDAEAIPGGEDLPIVPVPEHKGKLATQLGQSGGAAAEGPMKGILDYVDIPLVSGDYIGDPHSSIFDATITQVLEQAWREAEPDD